MSIFFSSKKENEPTTTLFPFLCCVEDWRLGSLVANLPTLGHSPL